jgi:hypothetical protein
MLLSAVIRPAQAMWQCEGENCGTTPWFCCCESPQDAQDENCKKSTELAKHSGECPSDCGCTLTIQSADAATVSTLSSLSVGQFYPLLLPQAPVAAPVALNLVARAIETRGPPPSSVVLSSAPLRAPPAV